MILIGELSLWVALLMAAWGTTIAFAGGRHDCPTAAPICPHPGYAGDLATR